MAGAFDCLFMAFSLLLLGSAGRASRPVTLFFPGNLVPYAFFARDCVLQYLFVFSGRKLVPAWPGVYDPAAREGLCFVHRRTEAHSLHSRSFRGRALQPGGGHAGSGRHGPPAGHAAHGPALHPHRRAGRPARLATEDWCSAALDHYQSLELEFDCIYSGYLASEAQVSLVEKAFDLWPRAIKVVDPVMGDGGKLYRGLTPGLCQALRRLCSRADAGAQPDRGLLSAG